MFESSRFLVTKDRRTKALAALIMAASAAVVGLMSAAVARDDAGARQFFTNQVESGIRRPESVATTPPASSRVEQFGARRVLTVSVASRRPARQVVASKPVSKSRLALSMHSSPKPTLFRADPRRPAVVSIYDDRTLRRGDAVMTLTGLRVFAGSRTFPYRPEDFTTLGASRNIQGQLRRALIELDQLPLRG